MKPPLALLTSTQIDTPIGPMMAIANETALCLLAFVARRHYEKHLQSLAINTSSRIKPGMTPVLSSIQNELALYFEGRLKQFKTPLALMGSVFQQQVWQALCQIPWGETRSYLALAKVLKKPTACRAVAQANAANKLAIVIPCHRVINANGALGGYAGGIDRKQWLLDLEKEPG